MKQKVDAMLRAAFELKASDIHLTVGIPPIFRINGDLKRYGQDVLSPTDTEQMAKAIVPEHMWTRFETDGELDLSYSLSGVSRFRVNVFKQRGCISLAIRIVPTKIPTLDELQLPDVLKKMVAKPQGLILVTGPTGSGKSTTLAAMIDYMNKTMRKHIITLEDPIEYVHKHDSCIIDQREVGTDTSSFANGLRAALRQDPDVILVGEMRDLETIQTAVTAAETGHLVFGTLHTSSAPATIDRIIDVFPPEQQGQIRIQLATVLVSIISQRLFPRAQNNGRIAATEILINNAAVANLIRNGKTHQIPSIMQTSRALGMHTLETSIKELVQQGLIAKEVVAPYLQEG
ncbi:type IV pilus twitching motility protein PilT [Anoxybacillus flavithermus]|uniref:Type IV pilus twitching motility protein PilT n=1 Tax=Anoxybacillus flavithermus TaxID=33934 RepID=A0AAX2A4J8_9BACL|nr:type IV pilus twitching motility protein PilT [Anoxybacillus flavithermus]ASA97804.1 type IV pili twitching motility protein PilT [Anoxybacillus flavithermus]MBE2926310.1 type IV pilus twitching motility protein PilT [Anoxybacillus flavithermus]MBE2936432.1 type IV pilus twitching motility protein PilT [Anoxybacillus flavithermus]MBE2944478.1 type IV pilus twitching motility protein PilT [Anoxybacillus flavithermus]MBE2947234.1 type IV pilus twitching motility protein PilT [Anoxybacillus fl